MLRRHRGKRPEGSPAVGSPPFPPPPAGGGAAPFPRKRGTPLASSLQRRDTSPSGNGNPRFPRLAAPADALCRPMAAAPPGPGERDAPPCRPGGHDGRLVDLDEDDP